MKGRIFDNLIFKDNFFVKDFTWYFIGSFLPLFIGFFKTPIFTRYFSVEDYGNLGIVNITFTYLGMFLFSWIGSCLWRYYSAYESNNRLKILYSNLFFLFLISFVILSVVSSVWYFSEEHVEIKLLVLFSFFHLLLNQLFLMNMVVIRLKRMSKYYTVFQSIRSFISLLTALILVFIFDQNISALISSLVIIDALIILFLSIKNPAQININLKLIQIKNLKEIVKYGGVGLILNISLLTITLSDRYIISWLGNIAEVGIYDQVYKISQLFIVSLITIFFNTVNPFLLKQLENNFTQSTDTIRKYIKVFVVFGLPIVFYLSMFSKEISFLLLGKEFRSGYFIMPFVFFSTYLFGLSNFFELRLKFSNRFRRLGLIGIGSALINIVLNIFLISMYDYRWAAIATAITYSFMIIIFYYYDKELLIFSKSNFQFIFNILLVLMLQLFLFISLIYFFDLNILFKILLGLLFVLSYYIIFKKQIFNLKIPI